MNKEVIQGVGECQGFGRNEGKHIEVFFAEIPSLHLVLFDFYPFEKLFGAGVYRGTSAELKEAGKLRQMVMVHKNKCQGCEGEGCSCVPEAEEEGAAFLPPIRLSTKYLYKLKCQNCQSYGIQEEKVRKSRTPSFFYKQKCQECSFINDFAEDAFICFEGSKDGEPLSDYFHGGEKNDCCCCGKRDYNCCPRGFRDGNCHCVGHQCSKSQANESS